MRCCEYRVDRVRFLVAALVIISPRAFGAEAVAVQFAAGFAFNAIFSLLLFRGHFLGFPSKNRVAVNLTRKQGVLRSGRIGASANLWRNVPHGIPATRLA